MKKCNADCANCGTPFLQKSVYNRVCLKCHKKADKGSSGLRRLPNKLTVKRGPRGE